MSKYKLPIKYQGLHWSDRRAVRLQYIEEQENKCFYCNGSLDESPPYDILSKDINWEIFPPNFLNHPIHLQHDHKTGMTEGAVHAYCNAVMWQYEGR